MCAFSSFSSSLSGTRARLVGRGVICGGLIELLGVPSVAIGRREEPEGPRWLEGCEFGAKSSPMVFILSLNLMSLFLADG